MVPTSYRIVGGAELRATARAVGQRMLEAAGGADDAEQLRAGAGPIR